MHFLSRLILVKLVCLPLTGWSANIHYFLDVQIDTHSQILTGIARLNSDEDLNLSFSTYHLSNLKVDDQLIDSSKQNINIAFQKGKEVIISYKAILDDESHHLVEPDQLFLTANWYPQPDRLVEYVFSVTLPKGFLATSEAETVKVQETAKTSTFFFEFPYLLDTLHLAASKNYVFKTDVYKDIVIETYFFPEEAHLADTYIEYTQKYLARYEEKLTPYPYRRFAIVEHLLPTGYSRPTYTLLGQAVVRLPFIVKTSLGHEILHQWLGNSVFVDYDKGNWAEGITHYLADHYYAENEGKGAEYRKQILVDYHAYVRDIHAQPVRHFSVVSDKASQNIGYGKAAMIFHMLNQQYGEDVFTAALQDFITRYSFRKANWNDIQKTFEKHTNDYLDRYFGQWLDRKDIPQVTFEQAELVVDQGQLTLAFTAVQHTEPYHLYLPLTIYTASGKKIQQKIEISQKKAKITLALDEPTTRVVVDENYDLMRQLLPQEIPPTLAAVMGKKSLLVVAAAEQRDLYQPLIEALPLNQVSWTTPETLQFSQLIENSIIFAGTATPIVARLFGKQPLAKAGVHLNVHRNPYNDQEVIVLLQSQDNKEVQAVKRKLAHYGHYSTLAFTAGKNSEKTLTASTVGIPLLTRLPTRVLQPEQIVSLDEIMPAIVESRVIYVGEQHNEFAHHINQLMIIKQLYEAGYQIAVGMEMFPISVQAVLDDYLADKIDERLFLKKSGYFSQWQADYHLYKPIIDYLKHTGIPLLALNINKSITNKVAKAGIHSLTTAEQQFLPTEIDFTNDRYRQDLYSIFLIHQQQFGYEHFDYFLQSQLLWDETMAQTAHQFLTTHPQTKLVVLTGNGHLKYRYGIPQRLYRRNGAPFTVIVQDETVAKGISDYVLLTEPIKGKPSPRLGIWTEEQEKQVVIKKVGKDTPAQQAGLQVGDKIIQFAGQKIQSLADLKLALFFTPYDSKVTIQFLRKGQKLTQKVTLFALGS